jgi:hypothetical protein
MAEKPVPADHSPPLGTAPLREPQLFAPFWMMTGALGDRGIPFWENLHKDISFDDCPLPGILALLGPYKWLFGYGTSEELAQKIETLAAAERIVEGKRAGKEDEEMRRLLFGELPTLLNPSPKRIPSPNSIVFADSIVRDADQIEPPLSDTQLASLRETAASSPPLLLVGNGLRRIRQQLEFERKSSVTAEKYLAEAGWRFDQPTRQLVATKEKRRGRSLLTLCMLTLAEEFGRGARDATVRAKIKEYLSPIFSVDLEDGPRGNIARALENDQRGNASVKGRRLQHTES